ncbi:MAG: 3-dehydroquinate synthase [Clostridiales bacterium]|nr:3-dehydroquinate synthase [Clostridiales bacterium]
MSKLIQVKENGTPIYDIRIEHNYSALKEVFSSLHTSNHRICIVSDTTISHFYMEEVVDIAKDYASVVETFTLKPGEEYKNLESVYQLYEYLIASKFDRKDFLIALGGGVVGDLTGYVAATYLRGISFIQLPTTLLSMVDSSIGGKTGVDFQAYKNMIGAFKQPKAVYINTATLKTLDDRIYFSGFGEVTKYGYIQDTEFNTWIKEHIEGLCQRDLDILEYMIYRSCDNKRIVVEEDPKELGIRATLNFGHTLGHAIEKMMHFKLLHGECVSIGMVAAAYISYKHGYLSMADIEQMKDTLSRLHLPVSVQNLDEQELIEITKNDKKMEAGKIKFILLEEIGKSIIDSTVTTEEMLEGFRYIVNK